MLEHRSAFARFLYSEAYLPREQCHRTRDPADRGGLSQAGFRAASDAGGHRAAALCTLIGTAKLDDVGLQVWLADVFIRLPDHPD